MASPPVRRFGVMDTVILVAALAVAAASIRPLVQFGTGMVGFFEECFPSVKRTAYTEVALNAVEPWLAALTVAFIVIRLRRPRPPFRRLVRQPGMAACLAVLSLMAVNCLAAGVALAILGTPREEEALYLQFVTPLFRETGGGVLAVWFVMVLAGVCRPEPGWVDRAGRLLGLCWVVMFLASTWQQFWFAAVTNRFGPPVTAAGPPALSPEETAAMERETVELEQKAAQLRQEAELLKRQLAEPKPKTPVP